MGAWHPDSPKGDTGSRAHIRESACLAPLPSRNRSATTGKVALREAVEYNEPPPAGGAGPGDVMLEELIQKADAEFKRIQRLRGYL